MNQKQNLEAKLKALLDYLLNPNEDTRDMYLIACTKDHSGNQEYTIDDQNLDDRRVVLLIQKDKNVWQELKEEVEEFDTLENLIFAANKKYGFANYDFAQ